MFDDDDEPPPPPPTPPGVDAFIWLIVGLALVGGFILLLQALNPSGIGVTS